jgi:DNA-binding HxlR family transcriptional regulator
VNQITVKYRHFCPIALALEKIGDKWSLLIVRDLLHKPQRFTDLMVSLGKITPRWLTLRLRELEATGIIERDSRKGRREVWYRLTPAGKELLPVIDTLLDWGLRHAMRTPQPGEVVNPELMMRGMTRTLNLRAKSLAGSRQWSMAFPQATFIISFDGNQWSTREGAISDPDVTIETTPESWAKISTTKRSERNRLIKFIHLSGNPHRIEEFKTLFGLVSKKNRTEENPK